VRRRLALAVRRRLALAATLTSALALAGCGSSALSAPQLRARAGRICSAARVATNRIPTPDTPSAGAPFLSRGISALAPELKALKRLQPGGDAATNYAGAVADGRQELQALRFTIRGLRAGNDPVVAIKTLQQRLAPLESRADDAWGSLGIEACATH
jgi:hypothetical protein